MEKSIEIAVERLTSAKKDWDFATVFFERRNPVMIERDSDIKRLEDSDMLVMNSVVLNPFPKNKQDSLKEFDMQSYIAISTIVVIDFYAEKRIQTVPASILSIAP